MKTKALFLLCTIFILTPLMFVPSIYAVDREVTVSDIAEQDASTSSGLPDTPIGSIQDSLSAGYNIAGNYIEAYFYFNFTNKPINYIKAELSLNLWGKSFPGPELNLTICLIEESWDEQTITWNNAPSKGQVLGYFIYNNDAGGLYKLDISSIVDGITNLSVCVYMEPDNFVDNCVDISSSEEYLMQEQAPQIIWTYIENAVITVSNPNSLSEWFDSDTFSITWLSQGQIENVRIELFEGLTPITNISSYEINDGIYNWTISSNLNLSGTNYRIKISDYYDPAVYGFSDPFSINNIPSSITVISPDSLSEWSDSETFSITWLSQGQIEYVRIELFEGSTPITNISSYETNDGIYTWTISSYLNLSGTNYLVKISDYYDPAVYGFSEPFSININIPSSLIPGYPMFLLFGLIILSGFYISFTLKRKRKIVKI